MTFNRGIFFLLFLFIITSQSLSFSQENPVLTITPQKYTKITIRIPTLGGDPQGEWTNLLRNLINSHLFCVALKEPPLPGFKIREFFLTGQIMKEGNKYFFQGELKDLFEGRPLKKYTLTATSGELLIYALADQIIKDISSFEGVSLTRISFVKRTHNGDQLYMMDFSKKNLRRLQQAELILFPKFSPSGKKLAYLVYEKGQYYLEIFTVTTQDRKRYKISEISSAPIWAPDERTLYLTLGKAGEVNIYKFSLDNENLYPLTSGKGIHQAGSLSPDGKLLAYVGDKTGKPQIYLLNLETTKTQRISFEGSYNTSPRFSPKKSLLIYLSGKRDLILYNYKTNERSRIHFPFEITDPTFSPTGDFLIFRAKGEKGEGLYIFHLDSQLLHSYLPYPNLFYPDWGKLF